MPKSVLKQKLKAINDKQEREINDFKKQVAEKYRPERDKLYEECATNGHKYDNGNTALSYSSRYKVNYCPICGQEEG